MAVKITYFVHGTTTDNEQEISSGWSDVELAAKGREQSHKLKELIADQKFDAVFCSDLKRALESAQITFSAICPIIVDERLRECNYGEYNGKLSNVVEPLQEQSIVVKFPQGESYEDVKARIKQFLELLKTDYDGKHIAIVAHKAPQLALDVLLRGWSWEEAFAQDWRKTKSWQPGWEYILE